MRKPIEQQRAWLQAVLAALQLSPTGLAKRAGVNPATLTRFLNSPEWPHELRPQTIRSLETASGMAFGGEERPTGLRESEASRYDAGGEELWDAVIRQTIGCSNGVDPWLLQSSCLEEEGYLPGDILLVDLNATPRAGDIVCVQKYEWSQERPQTLFRLYEPPYVVAAARGPGLRKPLVVDNDNIFVRGVVIGTVRPRPSTRAA